MPTTHTWSGVVGDESWVAAGGSPPEAAPDDYLPPNVIDERVYALALARFVLEHGRRNPKEKWASMEFPLPAEGDVVSYAISRSIGGGVLTVTAWLPASEENE